VYTFRVKEGEARIKNDRERNKKRKRIKGTNRRGERERETGKEKKR
jgi:hypothetical protein